MILIRFCFFCGTGYSRDNWNCNFECTECKAIFIPPKIIRETQVTLIEAVQSFSTKPLTDKKAVKAAKRNKKKNEL
jgi:hypothetical protein